VNLDEVLLRELVSDEEPAHILALIALQLDDLPQLGVLHHRAVATELCRGTGKQCKKSLS